jgi:GST-like protein
LYGVLEAQLARTGHYVAGGEYTIADMAIFPWIRTHKAQQIALAEFAHVERWYDTLFERPAARRGLDLGKELRLPKMDEEARKALFGQTAQSVRAGVHKQN